MVTAGKRKVRSGEHFDWEEFAAVNEEGVYIPIDPRFWTDHSEWLVEQKQKWRAMLVRKGMVQPDEAPKPKQFTSATDLIAFVARTTFKDVSQSLLQFVPVVVNERRTELFRVLLSEPSSLLLFGAILSYLRELIVSDKHVGTQEDSFAFGSLRLLHDCPDLRQSAERFKVSPPSVERRMLRRNRFPIPFASHGGHPFEELTLRRVPYVHHPPSCFPARNRRLQSLLPQPVSDEARDWCPEDESRLAGWALQAISL